MGRPERPLDPQAGPVAEFAAQLRQLRERAGRPSYRELARRANFSVTTLSEAAGGRDLPTLPVVLGYVRACGGDPVDWEQRWKQVAGLQRELGQDPGSPAPYRGLASYGVEDASWFFGRDQLTGELLHRLRTEKFLAVFGPSGSGKSSLLGAGVLAAVQRGELAGATGWEAILLTPGEQPLMSLAEQVAKLTGTPVDAVRDGLLASPEYLAAPLAQALADRPAGTGIVLVVDQFEELFTLCGDPAQRDRFVHALLALAGSAEVPARVLLGVRADFYGKCASWPALVAALHDAQILVGPMDPDQLRDAIVKPAERAGLTVDRALTATAIAEAGADPGALALVSHALLETWRYSPPGRLTLAAYQQAGGVAHAIASTAERVYAGCGDSQQRLLRQMVLRLIALGEGGPDTRRRVPRADLAGGDPTAADQLIERLAQARLITLDDGTVQLAHEALIRFWPRLAEWLAQDRESLRVQRRLASAAAEWIGYGRDQAALYRGAPLALALTWAERDGHITGLTPVEQEFLTASRTVAGRAAHRFRALVTALIVLLAAAGGAGWAAALQRAAALSSASTTLSGELAAQSAALAGRNPATSALTALGAWQARTSSTARSALLSGAAAGGLTQTSLPGKYTAGQTAAFSPNGKLLAAGGSDSVVHIWNTTTGRPAYHLDGPAKKQIRALAFSPGGQLLAVGATGGIIQLWDPARHKLLATLNGPAGIVEDVAFSPNGKMLAAVGDDGTVRLWTLGSPSLPGRQGQVLVAPGKSRMLSVAFSPDSTMLAAAGDDGRVSLWAVSNPEHPVQRPALAGDPLVTGAGHAISSLAFSPVSTPAALRLAGEDMAGNVLLWNPGHHTPKVIQSAAAPKSRGLGFSQAGTILLTVSYSAVQLLNAQTGVIVATEPAEIPGVAHALAYQASSGLLALVGGVSSVQLWQHAVPAYAGSGAAVPSLATLPGEPAVASLSADGLLRLWRGNGAPASTVKLTGTPDAVAVSPDGKFLATALAGGAVTIRSLPGLQMRYRLVATGHGKSRKVSLAFSPDGRTLAASCGPSVTLWNVVTGAPEGPPLTVKKELAYKVAFGPDGMLATVTNHGHIVVWDTRTGTVTGRATAANGPLNTVASSPDGQLLALGGNDGSLTVWSTEGRLHRLFSVNGQADPVRSVAFSPDGRTLAVGWDNGTITLLDSTNGAVEATLTGGAVSPVHALAFARDGRTLLSGNDAGQIIAWALDPQAVARSDCRMLAAYPGLSQLEKTPVPHASYHQLCPTSTAS